MSKAVIDAHDAPLPDLQRDRCRNFRFAQEYERIFARRVVLIRIRGLRHLVDGEQRGGVESIPAIDVGPADEMAFGAKEGQHFHRRTFLLACQTPGWTAEPFRKGASGSGVPQELVQVMGIGAQRGRDDEIEFGAAGLDFGCGLGGIG